LNKIVSKKIPNAIFLLIVLVAGTFAAISSSFIVGAQAEPYYGMDDRYDSYEPTEYPSYQPDYKPEYQSDNNYKFEKDSSSKSVSINKIKCINNNVNINGNNAGNVSIGNKGQGYLGGYSSDGSGGYGDGEGYGKQGKGFECIINNNNNNTNIVTGGGNVTDGNEILTCEDCFNENTTLATILTNILAAPGFIEVIPNVVIGEEVVTIAQLCDFLEREIAEGDIDQTTTGLTMVIDAILGSGPAMPPFIVTISSIEALVECLLDVDFPINTNGPLTPFDINTGTTNTDTSSSSINTAGGLTASSFSSPPTIAQGTTEDDLSALEKIEKLKQQWLGLLP
jgi:hypothetical protein